MMEREIMNEKDLENFIADSLNEVSLLANSSTLDETQLHMVLVNLSSNISNCIWQSLMEIRDFENFIAKKMQEQNRIIQEQDMIIEQMNKAIYDIQERIDNQFKTFVIMSKKG